MILLIQSGNMIASNAQAYSLIIPLFPATTRFVDIQNEVAGRKHLLAFKEDINSAILSYGKNIFVLTNEDNFFSLKPPFSPHDLEYCERIVTAAERIKICAVKSSRSSLNDLL
jgi:hypothetical protein